MRELRQTDTVTECPDNETWDAMIERIKVTDRIHSITEETYWYFLEVLPPKWLGQGYAFAEGQEPLQLFWQHDDEYRTRSLTWEQTARFCTASGLPRYYW